jgi:hypothetical protein
LTPLKLSVTPLLRSPRLTKRSVTLLLLKQPLTPQFQMQHSPRPGNFYSAQAPVLTMCSRLVLTANH